MVDTQLSFFSLAFSQGDNHRPPVVFCAQVAGSS